MLIGMTYFGRIHSVVPPGDELDEIADAYLHEMRIHRSAFRRILGSADYWWFVRGNEVVDSFRCGQGISPWFAGRWSDPLTFDAMNWRLDCHLCVVRTREGAYPNSQDDAMLRLVDGDRRAWLMWGDEGERTPPLQAGRGSRLNLFGHFELRNRGKDKGGIVIEWAPFIRAVSQEGTRFLKVLEPQGKDLEQKTEVGEAARDLTCEVPKQPGYYWLRWECLRRGPEHPNGQKVYSNHVLLEVTA
jgi:hypothetical protein